MDESDFVHGNPLAHPLRLIQGFKRYYEAFMQDSGRHGGWAGRLELIESISNALKQLPPDTPSPHEAWSSIQAIEGQISDALSRAGQHLLAPALATQVHLDVETIVRKIDSVETELAKFDAIASNINVSGAVKLRQAASDLNQIKDRLANDFESVRNYLPLAESVVPAWRSFLEQRRKLPALVGYRPALKQLNRLAIDETQEKLVASDYRGHHRIQGVSGSGKTLIAIHRAIRLATDHPDRTVHLVTRNRSLKHLIKVSSDQLLDGCTPPNLHVIAWTKHLVEMLDAAGVTRSRWLDAMTHRTDTPLRWDDFLGNLEKARKKGGLFTTSSTQSLLSTVTHQLKKLGERAVSDYLYEEVVYIQTGFAKQRRADYLNMTRTGRGLKLVEKQRMGALELLSAWEAWLEEKDLWDEHTVRLSAFDQIMRPSIDHDVLARFRSDHWIIDESQDLSTLDYHILSAMTRDPVRNNALFLVGDVQQRSSHLHCQPSEAGLKFSGRTTNLRRNYRNTRQILEAAYEIVRNYPAAQEEDIELLDPESSPFEGGKPLIYELDLNEQVEFTIDLIQSQPGCRIGVLGENEPLLVLIYEAVKKRLGLAPYVLLRNEDTPLEPDQPTDLASTRVVVSRMDPARGFEFDIVVLTDVSNGIIPKPNPTNAEKSVSAAVLYTAATRGRDQLIILHRQPQSPFVTCMAQKTKAVKRAEPIFVQQH